MTIRPMPKRILAEMLPPHDGERNLLGLTLVDTRKHFEHTSRKAKVLAVGRSVRQIHAGDVVVVKGSAGFTLDAEPVDESGVKGNEFRWLYERECLAKEVPA